MAGGSNNVARMSPRQRMINLMYIVLTAMLALNVSGDVLNGFDRVRSGLENTNGRLSERNADHFNRLAALNEANPVKAGAFYGKGQELRGASEQLVDWIESLKVEVAERTDGKGADYARLSDRENIDAAADVLLPPGSSKGQELKERLGAYRNLVEPLIAEGPRRKAILDLLATPDATVPGTMGSTPWEQHLFEKVPSVAAITLLTKLQGDIREAEAEAMASLIDAVDMGDLRVNSLSAYVIPKSSVVMRGSAYEADVVLAAVDTTKRPAVYVGGQKMAADGKLSFTASSPGVHDYSGYIEVADAAGSRQLPFTSSYTVIEPMATVSATLMNALYAGIDNPLSISVPGVPQGSVEASMTNGTLTRKGDGWVARPSKIGTDAVITVTANMEGRRQTVATTKFRVRKLPDPAPYIDIKSGSEEVRYKGAPRRISKAALLGAQGLGAAADDDFLNVSYTVVGFTMLFFDSMGNAMPEVSDGANFSARQRQQIQRLKPGKRFFISGVKAKGPDGLTRDIAPMEVVIN